MKKEKGRFGIYLKIYLLQLVGTEESSYKEVMKHILQKKMNARDTLEGTYL